MHTEKFGAGVFVIHDFLSASECEQHIQNSERIGFSEAVIATDEGDRIYKDARNNDRIVHDDAPLAKALYERARALLPQDFDGWQLCGFNEKFRFYRYQHQQFFKPHLDGTFRRSDAEHSILTFLMYLNDGFAGGYTDFIWDKVRPKAGSALVFPHRLMHQGSVVTAGVKYVLRTDVMYRKP